MIVISLNLILDMINPAQLVLYQLGHAPLFPLSVENAIIYQSVQNVRELARKAHVPSPLFSRCRDNVSVRRVSEKQK